MDAQHWGVPQRRLRISLVLDLTGGCAGEILFEPESLRGHFAPGITPGQATAGTVENGAGTADRAFTLKIRSGCEGGGKGALVQTEKSATLSTLQDQTLFVAEPPKAYSFDSLASNSMKSSNPHSGCREVEIAKTLDTSPPDPAKNQGGIAILDVLPFDTTQITSPQNGNNPHFGDPCHPLAATAHPPAVVCLNHINPVAEPLIYDARGNGDGITSPTMTGDHNSRVTDYTAITLQGDTVAGALLARDYKGSGRADSLGRVIAQPVGADLYNGTLTGDKAVTLTTATGQGGANTGPSVIEKIIRWIVRRLTPTECERLQGYPDGWTDLGGWVDSRGKAHKAADSPRYKALGNSIALPQWYYVLGGISDRLPEDATLGSLFDGIGGFPYVWAQLHAGRKELCVWASEIEEFPIAVTKKWFPEVEDGKLF
jgi:DNA (cytosine-5)-methyltransferase 1